MNQEALPKPIPMKDQVGRDAILSVLVPKTKKSRVKRDLFDFGIHNDMVREGGIMINRVKSALEQVSVSINASRVGLFGSSISDNSTQPNDLDVFMLCGSLDTVERTRLRINTSDPLIKRVVINNYGEDYSPPGIVDIVLFTDSEHFENFLEYDNKLLIQASGIEQLFENANDRIHQAVNAIVNSNK